MSHVVISDGLDIQKNATVFEYTSSNPLAVRLTDESGNYVAPGGAGGSGTEYTEDSASPANPVAGALSLRRRDALSAETTTDGDWVTANATNKGEVYVKHVDSIPVTGTFFQATQPVSAVSLPLPTGAATEATLATLLTLAGFQARINTLGQKTMANSTPVVLASDQTVIPVSDNGGSLTVDGTVAVSNFPATQNVADGGGSLTVDGTITANAGAGTFATKEVRSGTGTQTSVAGSASSVTLLASNANRLGATFYNDSTAILYLKCGATASTSSFAVKLFPEDLYEMPYGYTGVVDGIWASAAGNARVTEFT